MDGLDFLCALRAVFAPFAAKVFAILYP